MAKGFVEGRGGAPASRSICFSGDANETLFLAVGPFATGVVLQELQGRFVVSTSAAGFATVSYVIADSGKATVDNFRSGRALLGGSTRRLFGQPAFIYAVASRGTVTSWFYPGVEVHSGPVWVVCAVDPSALVGLSGYLSVRCVWPGWYGGYRVTPAEVKVVEDPE